MSLSVNTQGLIASWILGLKRFYFYVFNLFSIKLYTIYFKALSGTLPSVFNQNQVVLILLEYVASIG